MPHSKLAHSQPGLGVTTPGRRLAAAVLLAACAVATLGGQAKRPAAPDLSRTPVQTVWPLPPDPPRVKWVAAYGSAEDIEGPTRKSALDSFKEAVLGKDRAQGGQASTRRLEKPYGVAVDSTGRVFVADSVHAAVFAFDFRQQRFLRIGSAQSQALLRIPIGLAVDARDNLYVGDNGHGTIFVFGPDLNYLGTLSKPGELVAPTGLAVDSKTDRLYAVDTRRHVLVVYDLASGRMLRRVGKKGSQPGEFGWPSGVAVGPDGLVYVSDTMNYRVQVFDRDLKVIRTFGSLGIYPGQFRRPKGIAVDRDNIVYVVDSDFNNFQMFDSQGRPLLAVGSFGQRPGQMVLPAGIAVHGEQARIVVAEQLTHRIQVFERVSAPR